MRRTGQTRIEDWKHPKYGFPTQIYLERSTGEFRAELGETVITAKTLPEMRQALRKSVEQSVQLNWLGIIQIKIQGSGSSETNAESNEESASVDLSFERFWLAQNGDEWLICTVWHSEDFAGSDNYDPTRDRSIDDALPRRLNARKWWTPKGFNPSGCSLMENSHNGNRTHYVPYREDLWLALCDICGRIGILKKSLDDLVSSDKGRQQLIEGTTKLLPNK